MDWDHLRFAVAVARAGSLSGAARSLGVNHSTVFRRINTLEEDLGVRLFDRLPEGYALTAAGEEVIEHAERVDESIVALHRTVLGKDYQLTGDVRLTTAPNLATEFVAPALVSFAKQYPGIRVEIAVSDSNYDLARRQADLALRASAAPPDYLVGRRVMDLPWFFCGSRTYMKRAGTPRRAADLADHALIGAGEQLQRLDVFSWLHAQYAPERFVARAGDLNTIAALIEAGLGLGVLPADQYSPRVERLFRVTPEFVSRLWLLHHPDLRKVTRIKAFADHLFATLRADKRLREFVAGR